MMDAANVHVQGESVQGKKERRYVWNLDEQKIPL